MSHFQIIKKDKQARAGVLKTAHGLVETPIFMPVGTQATVKALDPQDLKNAGAQIILGNTYHLYLRPGNKLIKKIGGLHKFMNWQGPILTDSGGFQAFSLGAMIEHGIGKVTGHKRQVTSSVRGDAEERSRASTAAPLVSGRGCPLRREANTRDTEAAGPRTDRIIGKIDEEGIHFVSHLDGSKHLLSPEKSIEVQLDLGSDICLVLDELISPLHNREYVESSLERTHRWELRSKDYFQKKLRFSINPKSLLFGIVQGVQDEDIRKGEAKWVASQDFNGVSIGGSFGASEIWGKDLPREHIEADWANLSAITQAMAWIVPNLPEDWPKHALGIGEVADIFECVERGVDMFDCVAPTRRARNGSLYISFQNGGNKKNKYTLNISRTKYKDDNHPIDPGCLCFSCQNFSRAYLKHLYLSSEILYHRLATIHNVHFMLNLTKIIREAIINKQFCKLKKYWLE